MKNLQKLKEKIEKMYSSIPCRNCLIRPTCFNLSDDNFLFTVRQRCGEFFAWFEKTKIRDFWDVHYSNPIMRDKRREVLRKLF